MESSARLLHAVLVGLFCCHFYNSTYCGSISGPTYITTKDNSYSSADTVTNSTIGIVFDYSVIVVQEVVRQYDVRSDKNSPVRTPNSINHSGKWC